MPDAARLRQTPPLLWFLLLVSVVCLAVAPRAHADEMRMSMMGGALVSLSTEADTSVEPMARISVVAPLTDHERPFELLVDVDLGALPGESLDLGAPETFRSLEARLGVAWQPWDAARFSVYGGGGFGTRLPGDPSPRQRTVRWGELGLRLADRESNAISVGAGLDERLDGTYQPALMVAGSVRLGEASAGRFDIGALLVGRAILGLDFGQYGAARRDVVQVAIAASVGGAR